MSDNVYEMTIRLPSGQTQKIRIAAGSSFIAKQMAEAQYGSGCVVGSISRK